VFYKARIGSRKPGTKIKRCWNWACTLKRPPVRLSVQGLVATSGCTLGARLGARLRARLGAHLSVQSAVLHSNFRVLPLFHPKSPILISQHPNIFPKIVYRYMNSKGLSKTHQTWNQMLFQHNSPIEPIFTKPSTTTQFIPQIRNYEHPRYESSTTIPHNNNNINQTWFHQQSINNNSFFIIYG